MSYSRVEGRFLNSIYTLIFALLFVAGCSFIGGSERPLGDGQGYNGRTPEPPKEPKNLVTVKNGRVRCGFTTAAAAVVDVYDVTCRMVLMTAEGNEVSADGIAEGVSLAWKDPRVMEGNQPKETRCQVEPSQLSNRCEIQLASGAGTRLGFDVAIASPAESKVETDEVLLPYSVTTIGKVPELPVLVTDAFLGFQVPPIDPGDLTYGLVSSHCTRAGVSFFSINGYVYRYAEPTLTLYAGSGSARNFVELSHRLRIRFYSNYLSLACGEKALYILDHVGGDFGGRILQVTDEGEVQVLWFEKSEAGSGFKIWADFSFFFKSLSLSSDGSLFLVNRSTFLGDTTKSKVQKLVDGKMIPAEYDATRDGFSFPNLPPSLFSASSTNSSALRFGGVRAVAIGQDDSIVVGDFSSGLRKINSTKAGVVNNTSGVVNLSDATPSAISIAPDNSIYFAAEVLRRISPEGSTSSVQDGKLAASSVIAHADGSVYFLSMGLISDNVGIRRLAPSGIISDIPGTDNAVDFAFGPENSLYFTEWGENFFGLSASSAASLKRIDSAGAIANIQVISVDPKAPPIWISGLVAYSNGFLALDMRSGLVWRLKLLTQDKYEASIIFGGAPSKDCGAPIIRGLALSLNLEEQVSSSLASVCVGLPSALAVKDNCAEGAKEMTIVIAQDIGSGNERSSSNLVRITRPCF